MACGSCGGKSISDNQKFLVTVPGKAPFEVTGQFAAKVEITKAGSGTYTEVK